MCQAARERELRSRGGGGGGGGEGTEEELEVSRRAWEVNYREAAIFLEEGQNNDKFIHHPRYYLLSCAKNIVSTTISCRDRDALPAYLLVHSAWFNAIDLATSLVVLGLGFVEDTKSDAVQVPIVVHSSVELCALLLLTIMLFLRTRLGYSLFLWMMCQLLLSL